MYASTVSTMNLSPHTSTPHAPPHPPSSAPVPHVSPHTNYISPTPGYFNPHGTPQHQPVFYPYSPPQVYMHWTLVAMKEVKIA